jgi:hypothetical protein
MKKVFLVTLLFASAGCFSPNEPICSFACADSDPKCPTDYVCLDDGYCHLNGDKTTCGFSDASAPQDLAVRVPGDMAKHD